MTNVCTTGQMCDGGLQMPSSSDCTGRVTLGDAFFRIFVIGKHLHTTYTNMVRWSGDSKDLPQAAGVASCPPLQLDGWKAVNQVPFFYFEELIIQLWNFKRLLFWRDFPSNKSPYQGKNPVPTWQGRGFSFFLSFIFFCSYDKPTISDIPMLWHYFWILS